MWECLHQVIIYCLHHADYRQCQYKEVSGSYWTVFLHGIAHSTVSATEILNTVLSADQVAFGSFCCWFKINKFRMYKVKSVYTWYSAFFVNHCVTVRYCILSSNNPLANSSRWHSSTIISKQFSSSCHIFTHPVTYLPTYYAICSLQIAVLDFFMVVYRQPQTYMLQPDPTRRPKCLGLSTPGTLQLLKLDVCVISSSLRLSCLELQWIYSLLCCITLHVYAC